MNITKSTKARKARMIDVAESKVNTVPESISGEAIMETEVTSKMGHANAVVRSTMRDTMKKLSALIHKAKLAFITSVSKLFAAAKLTGSVIFKATKVVVFSSPVKAAGVVSLSIFDIFTSLLGYMAFAGFLAVWLVKMGLAVAVASNVALYGTIVAVIALMVLVYNTRVATSQLQYAVGYDTAMSTIAATDAMKA